MKYFTIYEKPNLKQPYMVGGFLGWPDAGKVSTGVINYLKDKLEAKKFAVLSPDDFYVYQYPETEWMRPVAEIEDGLIEKLNLSSTEFWAWNNKEGAHDLIFLLGMEPQLRWNQFVDTILDLAHELKVVRIYTIGSTYDSIPHTREPLITASVNDESFKAELAKYNIMSSSYKGPSSIHSLLLYQAGKRNIKAANLWGHAPHYIQVPNDKVCYHILAKLTEILEINPDLEDIRKAGEHLDKQVNYAIAQKEELKEYVTRLEAEYGRGRDAGKEPPATEIIKEVEDFLRKRKHTEK